MTSHVILARADDGSADWLRLERVSGRWRGPTRPMPLEACVDDLVKTLSSARATPDVTISCFRKASELGRFDNPEDFGLAGRCEMTYILCPLGGAHGARRWGALGYVSPDRPPAIGQTFDRPALSDLLRDYLDDVLDRERDGAARLFEELWVRQGWTAERIAPSAFSPAEGDKRGESQARKVRENLDAE